MRERLNDDVYMRERLNDDAFRISIDYILELLARFARSPIIVAVAITLISLSSLYLSSGLASLN